MGGRYRVAPVEHTEEAVEQFRQDVLNSPSLARSGFGEQQLREIGSRIAAACRGLETALKAYAEAHQGDAAQATQAHLARVVMPGLRQMDKLYALAETMTGQTVSFGRVHDELAAAEESNWGNLFGLLSDARETAVVRSEYANDTNSMVTGGLPVFDPAPAEAADPRAFSGSGGPAVGGAAGLGGIGADLTSTSGAPVPTEIAGALPGAGASGAAGVPGGAGGLGAGGGGAPGTAAVGPGGSAGTGAQPTPAGASAGAVPVPTGLGGSGGARRREGGAPSSPNAGLRGTSDSGIGSLPGAAGRWGGPEGAGSRGSPGGVIRPEVPREARESEPAPRPRPGAERLAAGEPLRPGVTRGGGPGGVQQPLMPVSGAGGRGGDSRRRPEWLVEPDPDSYWLADVPASGPSVIRPNEFDER